MRNMQGKRTRNMRSIRAVLSFSVLTSTAHFTVLRSLSTTITTVCCSYYSRVVLQHLHRFWWRVLCLLAAAGNPVWLRNILQGDLKTFLILSGRRGSSFTSLLRLFIMCWEGGAGGFLCTVRLALARIFICSSIPAYSVTRQEEIIFYLHFHERHT